MPIVIRDFFLHYNQFVYHYTNNIFKSINIKTLKQRKNFDTISNVYFYPHGVIIGE